MFVIPGHPVTVAYRQLKDRGIKLRFIAEINKDNIQYCKELMKICDVLHFDVWANSISQHSFNS